MGFQPPPPPPRPPPLRVGGPVHRNPQGNPHTHTPAHGPGAPCAAFHTPNGFWLMDVAERVHQGPLHVKDRASRTKARGGFQEHGLCVSVWSANPLGPASRRGAVDGQPLSVDQRTSSANTAHRQPCFIPPNQPKKPPGTPSFGDTPPPRYHTIMHSGGGLFKVGWRGAAGCVTARTVHTTRTIRSTATHFWPWHDPTFGQVSHIGCEPGVANRCPHQCPFLVQGAHRAPCEKSAVFHCR